MIRRVRFTMSCASFSSIAKAASGTSTVPARSIPALLLADVKTLLLEEAGTSKQ